MVANSQGFFLQEESPGDLQRHIPKYDGDQKSDGSGDLGVGHCAKPPVSVGGPHQADYTAYLRHSTLARVLLPWDLLQHGWRHFPMLHSHYLTIAITLLLAMVASGATACATNQDTATGRQNRQWTDIREIGIPVTLQLRRFAPEDDLQMTSFTTNTQEIVQPLVIERHAIGDIEYVTFWFDRESVVRELQLHLPNWKNENWIAVPVPFFDWRLGWGDHLVIPSGLCGEGQHIRYVSQYGSYTCYRDREAE